MVYFPRYFVVRNILLFIWKYVKTNWKQTQHEGVSWLKRTPRSCETVRCHPWVECTAGGWGIMDGPFPPLEDPEDKRKARSRKLRKIYRYYPALRRFRFFILDWILLCIFVVGELSLYTELIGSCSASSCQVSSHYYDKILWPVTMRSKCYY